LILSQNQEIRISIEMIFSLRNRFFYREYVKISEKSMSMYVHINQLHIRSSVSIINDSTTRLSTSDDTAVILNGIHVSGPPTSWNWLITHSLTLVFSAYRVLTFARKIRIAPAPADSWSSLRRLPQVCGLATSFFEFLISFFHTAG